MDELLLFADPDAWLGDTTIFSLFFGNGGSGGGGGGVVGVVGVEMVACRWLQDEGWPGRSGECPLRIRMAL